MITLTPLTTTNLLTIIQILVVAAGFWFSYKSLRTANSSLETARASLATAVENLGLSATNSRIAADNARLTADNARAQLFNQMIIQGRDLQWRRWSLFVDSLPENATAADRAALEQKRAEFLGIVLAYYASCFELRQVLALPESVTRLLDAEAKEIMRHRPFQEKFAELKHLNLFSRGFIEYMENLPGV